MSGHSKWSQIKRQKGVTDQKRGQTFTKIANAITIAVREGGSGDPGTNFRLRLVMEKAKEVNMPKENIQRAIDKGLGKGGAGEIEEVMYEGFGPNGVAILVEAATDNKQRTSSEIKNIFDRGGGSMAGQGAVSWMFSRMGQLVLDKNQKNEDEAMLELMDLGVEDVEVMDSKLGVYVKAEELFAVRQKAEGLGYRVESAEIIMKPKNLVTVEDREAAKKILTLLEKLENIDDVQKVDANFDIPEAIMKEMV